MICHFLELYSFQHLNTYPAQCLIEYLVYSRNATNICCLNIDLEKNVRNFYDGNVFYRFSEKVWSPLPVAVREDFKTDQVLWKTDFHKLSKIILGRVTAYTKA